MKKEHPHAQVLRWIADGEDVQVRISESPKWIGIGGMNSSAMSDLMRGEASRFDFRVKPKTITVGDREIEAPVMSGPGYYITDHGDVFRWFGEATVNPYADLQKLGRVYATEEAARAAQEAITALLTQEPS